MSQPTSTPPARRKRSVVLDGAGSTTILVVLWALMSRSGFLLTLVASGWAICGLVLFIRRLGKVGGAIVVICLAVISTWAYLGIRAGTPKRELVAQIYRLGAQAVHTDDAAWAPKAHFVLFDDHVGDDEIRRFTQLAGLTDLRHVHFNRSRITDKSVDSLARLTQLQRLGIRFTPMTPEGVERLQQQLPNCQIEAEWAEDHSPSGSEPE